MPFLFFSTFNSTTGIFPLQLLEVLVFHVVKTRKGKGFVRRYVRLATQTNIPTHDN